MDHVTIEYHNRRLVVDRLKKVALQGCIIKVSDNQLNLVHPDDSDKLIVAAVSSGRGLVSYDVLAGTPKQGVQQALLVSKVLLKKADEGPPVAIGGSLYTPDNAEYVSRQKEEWHQERQQSYHSQRDRPRTTSRRPSF
jgi:hypothetical protein